MPTEVIMPKVDMDMAKGKIMSWHIAEGDRVSKGDPLFDIETDKAAMEVEAPADGILHHTAPEGMDIPIGTPCAWLYAEGEEVGEQPAPFAGQAGAAPKPEPVEADVPNDTKSVEAELELVDAIAGEATGKVRATPRARSLASGAGLNIVDLIGTGPRGRVQELDVENEIALRDTRPAPLAAPVTFKAETGALAVTRSKGGTGTPIMMIHGFASDATSWAPMEAHLKHRPLIRIDLPGHGKSPKLRIDSFAELVREVRRAFDDLNLDAAHLVGHSLGGAVSIALADTRAKRLSSLTLIAPAGLGPDINGDALSGMCRATRAESLGPWLRSLVANEDIVTDSYVRLAMAGREDTNLRAAQSCLADSLFPDGVQAFDLRAALERIDTPTRIIWGKQDAIIPWKHALRAPGKMALHLFDGVGHMPQIECSAELGRILSSSL
ncbi:MULTISPECIES: acetoin dehydrogenase dihydrolipoyllysine-residue acetyltransferase subunit [Marivita]|uniref:Acetoin dehydrogenase dihydrolipoyllysine-residue acetyltransferase subunit n=1 Tax=Marivita cryptomonadis TaxID=505252 RepID=A0A9Q2S0D5_9RHOB|nr:MULTISPECIES: acetoin dehydrogenase dihydrolipoyllysine-residue acetyltransferase subunit [Marivita]MCR9167796.1 acetoin dehydrogenase dihydrolipoyllysine-residue acetyltransferase subunit [Paracoccaceae bacterium]MBM2320282.1 acetoin dehydrogenase dihydrolipoyllysine-residue acetyltransferase subunit [Marivita cryptomonadis]MBM2329861.1 acetoin dehydrogenase dihydrolipoyllysine-residue acetyltransferase subunit [Marivita cryptomonadis]MBM2339449.1 acetoin dehydrogenase dihydrolipoyllysine-r